jgi:hypothetical protein
MRRLLGLLAILSVVAGCSTSVAGAPTPQTGSPGASSGVKGLDLPPRPRELKLDGLDPCSPFTPARLAKLGLDQTVPSIPTDPAVLVGRICTASGFERQQVDVSVAFVTHPGIEYVTEAPAVQTGNVEIATIAGFPVVVEPEKDEGVCALDIDNARDQFINIRYQDSAEPSKLDRTELCRRANLVGQDIMQFLLEK